MVVHVVQWPIFASPERIGSVSSCSVRRGESEDLQLVSTGWDVLSIMKDKESIERKERRGGREKIQREKWEEVTGPANKQCKHEM